MSRQDIDEFLNRVDEVATDRCATCTQPLRPDGPSPDFCGDECARVWRATQGEQDRDQWAVDAERYMQGATPSYVVTDETILMPWRDLPIMDAHQLNAMEAGIESTAEPLGYHSISATRCDNPTCPLCRPPRR